MKRFIFPLIYLSQLFAVPYFVEDLFPITKDDELISLWDSFDNIYQPTIDDYRKVSTYLKYGKRPYLDPLFNHVLNSKILAEDFRWKGYEDRTNILSYRVLQDMQFVGPNNESPIFKEESINGASIKDKSCCIILYASYNKEDPHIVNSFSLYSQKIETIIKELEEVGYKGHVVYRVGGYPLEKLGGLRFAHIPYSFKLLSFIEASLLGYENVLWLDCSIHPANDLSEVFQEIAKTGHYLLKSSVNLDFDYKIDLIPDQAIFSSGVDVNELFSIPHVMAGILGISFSFQTSHELLDEWFYLTSRVHPAMSLHPEEFLISIASWRTNSLIAGTFLEKILNKSEVPIKPTKGKKPFWFEKQ